MDELESKLLDALNDARQHPDKLRERLEEMLQHFKGNNYFFSDGAHARTHEGKAAVEEAIRFLKTQPPVPPIEIISPGLDHAAADHVADLGPKGTKGHDGSDGSSPFDRMERYGGVLLRAGENIFFGDEKMTAEEMVALLVIDDGVPDRGHRSNVFDPEYNAMGIECGPHAGLGMMCVFEYTEGFLEKDGHCSPEPCPAVPIAGTYTFTVKAGTASPGDRVTFTTPGKAGVPVKHDVTVPEGARYGDLELSIQIVEGFRESTSRTMDDGGGRGGRGKGAVVSVGTAHPSEAAAARLSDDLFGGGGSIFRDPIGALFDRALDAEISTPDPSGGAGAWEEADELGDDCNLLSAADPSLSNL